MKKILFAVSILLSISAFSQVDSSSLQLPIRLAQKVKYWAIEGSYLTTKSPFSDTALSCIGSGTQLDSISTGTVRAGRFYQLFARWLSDPAGPNYVFINDILSSSAANGGLIAQLNAYISTGTANQKKIAQWLKMQIVALIKAQGDAGDAQVARGIINLSTLTNIITDN